MGVDDTSGCAPMANRPELRTKVNVPLVCSASAQTEKECSRIRR